MTTLNLLEETKEHFAEGAKSVRAYGDETAIIITQAPTGEFFVTREEPGFPKTRVSELESYFVDVFGIEALY